MVPNTNISGISINPNQTINGVKRTDTQSERRKRKEKDVFEKRKDDSVQINSKTKNRKDMNRTEDDDTYEPASNYSEIKGKNIDIIIK
jgi:hypothetical protein